MQQLIKRRSSKKKTLFSIIFIILILVGALSTLYVYAFNGDLFGWTNGKSTATPEVNKVNYDKPTDEQKQSTKDSTDENIKTNGNSNSTSDNTGTETSKQTIAVTISSANQKTNGDLDVRTTIATMDSGTCTLTLTKAGSPTVTETAGTQVITNYSACSGFLIPKSQLGTGSWLLKISFNGTTTEGSASTNVELQ